MTYDKVIAEYDNGIGFLLSNDEEVKEGTIIFDKKIRKVYNLTEVTTLREIKVVDGVYYCFY